MPQDLSFIDDRLASYLAKLRRHRAAGGSLDVFLKRYPDLTLSQLDALVEESEHRRLWLDSPPIGRELI